MIDENGAARLTDFGLLSVSESQSFITAFTAQTLKGSVRWMAPELLNPRSGAIKQRSSDVYAFGMTILEVSLFTIRHSSTKKMMTADMHRDFAVSGIF